MSAIRPSFAVAWAASMRIYDATKPGAKVAQVIGGNVAKNIDNPDPNQRWTNTCAVRMSYILNQCGVLIPHSLGKTASGADRRWYFFRVRDVIAFLRHQWGDPDSVIQYPPPGGGALAGKKGAILFEVTGWSDAAGHATLWSGNNCYDHCYFNERGATYRTDRASFWSLS